MHMPPGGQAPAPAAPAPAAAGGGWSPISLSSPSAGQTTTTNIFQALSQLPQILQQQKTERQQSDLESAQMDAMQSKMDDAQLAQIAAAAQSNPAYATSPAVLAQIQKIYSRGSRKGLPPPIVNGALDVNALTPKKSFDNDLSFEQKTELSYLPKEKRAAMLAGFTGVRPEFLEAEPGLKPYAGVEKDVFEMPFKIAQKIADPNGGGLEAGAALLHSYTPWFQSYMPGWHPENILDSPEVREAIQKRISFKMDQLRALNILKPEAEAAYKNNMTQYYQGKLLNDQARTRLLETKDAAQEARWRAQTSTDMGKLTVMQGRLKAIQDAATAAGGLNPSLARVQLHTAQAVLNQVNQVESRYKDLIKFQSAQIGAGNVVSQDVIDQIASLKSQMDSLHDAGKAAEAVSIQMMNKSIAQTTGTPVTTTNYQPRAPQQAEPQQPSADDAARMRINTPQGTATWKGDAYYYDKDPSKKVPL
jgi:hypothetical protein